MSERISFNGGDFSINVFGGIAGRFIRGLEFTQARNLAAGDVIYVLETIDDVPPCRVANDWIKVSARAIDGNFSKVSWAPEVEKARKFVRLQASQ